jgi:4-alpha-glucanotransferase
MTSQIAALERLAERAGVATTYEDVFGVRKRASPESLRAVLAALGLDASDEAAAERAARALAERSWRRALEPVYVFAAGAAAVVAVTRPRDDGSAELTWELVAEGGAARTGRIRFGALPLLERASIDGVPLERRALELPSEAAEAGYYRLVLRADGDVAGETTVVRAPRRCWSSPAIGERGVWGLAVQLYGLRSARNWGIGDFTDLATLCSSIATLGGSVVGLNPLHDVRLGANGAPSPYAPSSRLFTSWLYLDIERVPGFDPSDVDRERLATARASADVDYATVAALKTACARRAFERFRAAGGSPEFDAYVSSAGDALARAATFDAIARHVDRDGPRDWETWPAPYRDPASPDVRSFARREAIDVAYFAYLQWQTDVQLAACVRASQLAVGLYRDLAVGADVGGSDTWSFSGAMTRGASVGAPPDVLNTRGQNWGVAPFDPLALREVAYAPFVALLRANMRHAGALRIDHVMALARLYFVPSGSSAADGAFVSYELDELLGIVALESARARCMVIGEDLGTVPAGFREKLEDRGVLSYRLLQFEVDDDGFVPPSAYPSLALVATGTHDLPPMGAYWTASDVDLRSELGFFDDGAATSASERDARERRREQLLAAFDAALGADDARSARFRSAAREPNDRAVLADVALTANRFLAQSPAQLLMVQLEDVFGDTAQVNVPTTVDEHPNWRRRASLELERFSGDARLRALAAMLRESGRDRKRVATDGPE